MSIRLKTAGLGLALAAASAASSQGRADDVSAPGEKTGATWVADFDKAVELAKKEHKDLLIDFTGSDWCSWCIRLHEEVFAHDDFLAAAQKEYVLVSLDFPHGKEALDKVPNIERNKELAKKYGVRGYPTILLMTPEGDVFGTTGYQKGGSENYVQHIAQLRAEGMPELKASSDLAAAIEKAKPEELGAMADKAIAAFEELAQDSDKIPVRARPVKSVVAADPDNKAGLAAKAAKVLFQRGVGDAAVVAAAQRIDPKNEAGLLEHSVMAQGAAVQSVEEIPAFVKAVDELFAMGEPKDKKIAKSLAANCMFMNYKHVKDLEKAKVYAKKVEAMGFEEGDDRLKKLVESVLAAEAPPAK